MRSSDLTHHHSQTSTPPPPPLEPYTPLFSPPPATPLPGIAAQSSSQDEGDDRDEFGRPSSIKHAATRSHSTVAQRSSGFNALTALKSFRAIFSRAKVPFGKRRQPSVSRPTLPPQTLASPVSPPLETISEEEQLVQQYQAEAVAKEKQDVRLHCFLFSR